MLLRLVQGALTGVGLWWFIGHPFWLAVSTCVLIFGVWGVILILVRNVDR